MVWKIEAFGLSLELKFTLYPNAFTSRGNVFFYFAMKIQVQFKDFFKCGKFVWYESWKKLNYDFSFSQNGCYIH